MITKIVEKKDKNTLIKPSKNSNDQKPANIAP